MAQTIAGIVEKPADAQRLIDELVDDCLCDRSDISVMVRDSSATAFRDAVARSASAATRLLNELYGGVDALSRSFPGGGTLRVIGKLGVALANAGIVSAAELVKR